MRRVLHALQQLPRRVADLFAHCTDATFEDLNWQAYCDAESKSIDMDTMDMSLAVLTLVSAGYAVVRIARHAKLIYVVPVACIPPSASLMLQFSLSLK